MILQPVLGLKTFHSSISISFSVEATLLTCELKSKIYSYLKFFLFDSFLLLSLSPSSDFSNFILIIWNDLHIIVLICCNHFVTCAANKIYILLFKTQFFTSFGDFLSQEFPIKDRGLFLEEGNILQNGKTSSSWIVFYSLGTCVYDWSDTNTCISTVDTGFSLSPSAALMWTDCKVE